MQLNELFNNPYEYDWGNPLSREYTNTAQFWPDEGDDVLVEFSPIRSEKSGAVVFDFEFSRGGTTEITHEGDAFRIFATIAQIFDEFINKVQPDEILAGAKEPSRKKLYRRMFAALAKKYDMYFNGGKGSVFKLVKRERYEQIRKANTDAAKRTIQ